MLGKEPAAHDRPQSTPAALPLARLLLESMGSTVSLEDEDDNDATDSSATEEDDRQDDSSDHVKARMCTSLNTLLE